MEESAEPISQHLSVKINKEIACNSDERVGNDNICEIKFGGKFTQHTVVNSYF